MSDITTDPTDIDLAGPTAPLIITWGDGHTSRFEPAHLRLYCPCAECTDHGARPMEERLAKELSATMTTIKMISEVGSYALTITWGDGHAFGIYSYKHLRAIDAEAPERSGVPS